MDRGELAKSYFLQGYNCTQAVCLAFAEKLRIDQDTLLRLVSAFGGGMGRMREVCGAVSGMFFVLGALEGYSDPEDHDAKIALYRRVQELAEAFRETCGSIICRELLPGKIPVVSDSPEASPRTEAYYKKRPCPDIVASAASILEKKLFPEK